MLLQIHFFRRRWLLDLPGDFVRRLKAVAFIRLRQNTLQIAAGMDGEANRAEAL